MSSVDEALQLVMYSSRAISDMKRALDNLDISPWNMKAIVREFVGIFFRENLKIIDLINKIQYN